MTTKKAKAEALEDLHATLATTLADAIKYPGDGGVQAAILNVARQFLKDNGIQADISNNAALSELNDLPVFDESEKPHARH